MPGRRAGASWVDLRQRRRRWHCFLVKASFCSWSVQFVFHRRLKQIDQLGVHVIVLVGNIKRSHGRDGSIREQGTDPGRVLAFHDQNQVSPHQIAFRYPSFAAVARASRPGRQPWIATEDSPGSRAPPSISSADEKHFNGVWTPTGLIKLPHLLGTRRDERKLLRIKPINR